MNHRDDPALAALLGQIAGEIAAGCEAQGLTVAELARRASRSKRGVIRILKTQGDPKLSTLQALYGAVGRRLVISSSLTTHSRGDANAPAGTACTKI